MAEFNPAKPVNKFEDINVIVSPLYVGKPSIADDGACWLSIQFMRARKSGRGYWESEAAQSIIRVSFDGAFDAKAVTSGLTPEILSYPGVSGEKHKGRIRSIFQDFANFHESMKQQGFGQSRNMRGNKLGTPLSQAQNLYKPL